MKIKSAVGISFFIDWVTRKIKFQLNKDFKIHYGTGYKINLDDYPEF